MQKNGAVEFTSYITPDGEEYQFDTNVRFLLSEEGLGMPGIEYITQKGPFQHGETLIDFRLSPRIIQMLIRNNGCSRDEYWANRRLMMNMLRPNRQLTGSMSPGVLRKKFSDGSVRDIQVLVESGPVFSAKNLNSWDEWGIQESIRFVAFDPTFYDPVIKSVNSGNVVVSDPNNWVLSFSFAMIFGTSLVISLSSVTYNGTWSSFPTITLEGPMNNFSIQNSSTGELIEYTRNILAGEIVVISLEFGNKTVTDGTGNNLIGFISPESDLETFHIAPDPEVPGGVNDIYVNAVSLTIESRVTISYYERFIGI
jgi:hypothetical protein